jgi:hypothetical protein
MKCFLLVVVLLMSLSSCLTSKEVAFASRNNNVCKTLDGRVVVYAIFVDSKETKPWTTYDIESTLDSIQRAMDWVMDQAKLNRIPLDIQIEYHKSNTGQIPLRFAFVRKTLFATLFTKPMSRGIRDVDNWANTLARKAGKSLDVDTSEVVRTANKMNDRERLVARLRDIHGTDNVALMYFINNYHTDEVSVAMHTASDKELEYAIVSYKYPSVIAHEFLHLFGAWDLYYSHRLLSTPRRHEKRMNKKFPNEIMCFTYRNIDTLQISEFTKYCIGWNNKLDKRYSRLVLGRRWRPLVY